MDSSAKQDRRFVRTLHGRMGATTLTLVGAVMCISALMQIVMLVLVAYSVAASSGAGQLQASVTKNTI